VDVLFLLIVPVVAALGYVAGRYREKSTLRGVAEMAVVWCVARIPRSHKVGLLALRAFAFLPGGLTLDLLTGVVGFFAFLVVHHLAPAWEAVPMVFLIGGASAFWHSLYVGKGAKTSGRKVFVVSPEKAAPTDKAAETT
jgi:hypothetical protein